MTSRGDSVMEIYMFRIMDFTRGSNFPIDLSKLGGYANSDIVFIGHVWR